MNKKLFGLVVCTALLTCGITGCGQSADHKPSAAEKRAFQGDASKMPASVRENMKNMSPPQTQPAPTTAPR